MRVLKRLQQYINVLKKYEIINEPCLELNKDNVIVIIPDDNSQKYMDKYRQFFKGNSIPENKIGLISLYYFIQKDMNWADSYFQIYIDVNTCLEVLEEQFETLSKVAEIINKEV